MFSKIFCVTLLLTLSSGYTQDISPLGQLVSYVGGSANFRCSKSFATTESANDMTWTLNNMSLNNSELVTITFDPNLELGRITLRRLTLLDNATLVRCCVHFPGRIETSDPSTLIVDPGLLSEVRSLDLLVLDHVISLNWMAPLPLNITGLNPDVTYTVDVVTSSAVLHSEDGITVTEFNYTLPSKAICDRVIFTVTPVNVVGPGKESTVQYEPIQAPQFSGFFQSSIDQVLILMTAPVCRGELTFVDIDTGETITLGDAGLTIEVTNISFTTQQLRQNRRYNVTIIASNAVGSNNNENNMLTISTHDILDVTLSEKSIMTVYVEQSRASGALLTFILLNDGIIDFTRSTYRTVEKNASLNYTLPLNLHPGQYMAFVYDIEQDGILQNGVSYPASMKNFSAEGDHQDSLPSENGVIGSCRIMTSSCNIAVECDSSNSMATGFQMIVQADNSSKVGKLYVNQTTDLETSTSVVVEENGMYQVTIFAIRGGSGIVESSVEYSNYLTVACTSTGQTRTIIIASSVVGGVVVLLILTLIVVLLVINRKQLCRKKNKVNAQQQKSS